MIIVLTLLIISLITNVLLYLTLGAAKDSSKMWWENYCNMKEKHDNYKKELYKRYYRGELP